MGNYASAIIRLAEKEIGYKEKASNYDLDSKTANVGNANYTKYARDIDNIPGFYNGKKNGFAWCDVFVDWLFVQAFGVDEAKRLLNQPDNSCGAGVDWSANYFKRAGRFYTSPKVGDQIFFTNSNYVPCHTGIVYRVDNGTVYTIEGNTNANNGVVDNGGMVCMKAYNISYSRIYGYGRPDYDPEPENTKEEEEMTTETRYNTIEEMPSYAVDTIKKLVRKEYLKGDGNGYDLSLDMIRMFVILDRAGMFGE